MRLSILICSLTNRASMLNDLINNLSKQIKGSEIEILIDCDNGQITTGEKRNKLLNKAIGDYLCFVDDDDTVSSKYIESIKKALESNPDCCSLVGVMTWNGDNPEIFEHSIKYKEYKTNKFGAITYERYPNHLNVIKSSIAKQFKFPEINFGEDTDWATQIFNSGLLQKEAEIKGVIYEYKYKSK